MNVFTYGSLMFDPVWQHVVRGRDHRSLSAALDGFARFAVAGHTYPGVIAQAGAQVNGRLYFDVAPDDLARLDDFEGGDYDRIAVTVLATDAGSTIEVPAQVYLYRLAERLSDRDWDAQWFAAEGIHRFMREYCPSPRDA